MRLNRGPHKSGIRLTIDMLAARVPISVPGYASNALRIRSVFVIIYPEVIKTLRRVAVFTKGILRKI